MSIRSQLLLLLLAIALLPIALSAWHSVRQIDEITDSVARATRANLLQRDRRYMREKVADIGCALTLTGRATVNHLRQQQLLIERALQQDPVTEYELLLCDEVPTLASAVDETRFRRAGEDGFAYQETAETSLWYYVALDQGVSMVYPGHGDYHGHHEPTWLPLTIDASTGQPVLTVATAVRDADGAPIGVTAIDLPLRQLLRFQSAAKPWLNSARLALLSDIGDSVLFECVQLEERPSMMAITAINRQRRSWLALASPLRAIEQAVDRSLAMLEAQRQAVVNRQP